MSTKKKTEQQSQGLVALNKIRQELAAATKVEEVVGVRGKLETCRIWAEQASLGLEIQNDVVELRLRAERKAGQMLGEMNLRGGDRKSNGHAGRLILNDLGISQHQSKRWQKLGVLPQEDFDTYVKGTRECGGELSTAGAIGVWRQLKKQQGENGVNGNGFGNLSSVKHEIPAGDRRDEPLDEVSEMVAELANHRDLLASLVEPIIIGEEHELKTAQRKMAVRLFREMKSLIGSLSVAVAKSPIV